MNARHLSDGLGLDLRESGRAEAASSWLPASSVPFFPIDSGANAAGDGGNGYFTGSLIDDPYAEFGSFNMAQAAGHATAGAHQTNVGIFDQSASQTAGIGGDGGDSNLAMDGSVAAFGAFGSDAIATGDNGAGQGGDGHFMGTMIHSPVAIFDPVNIAVAGFGGTADAHQSNTAQFHQSAIQFAGGGGGGGSGNAAIGGGVSSGSAEPGHAVFGSDHASGQGLIGSDAVMSGDNQSGSGGDGYFYGSLVHTSIALYDPINIAVAGSNSSAHADQSNNVTFDQSAVQIAGVGGTGGNGNAAIGGDASLASTGLASTGLASILGLIGSDAIATGGNSAGHGGDGHFSGSLVDLSIAIYAPINIAVAAGSNSTADAQQTNNVAIDQGAIQVAGIGGDGGHGNAALGGDFAAHLLGDLHLSGHG
jgi:hypothetical protein